jgi:hypothetical protein
LTTLGVLLFCLPASHSFHGSIFNALLAASCHRGYDGKLNGPTTDSTTTWLCRNRSRGDACGVFEASASVITRVGFHRSREHGVYARIE